MLPAHVYHVFCFVARWPQSAAAHVAKEVECAMDLNTPYFSKKEDYLGKARQLVFNLKKNDQLRCCTVRVRVGINSEHRE